MASRPMMSVDEPKIAPTMPAAMPTTLTRPTRSAEARREREEARAAAACAAVWRGAPAPGMRLRDARERRDGGRRSSGTATSRGAAVGRQQQRLASGVEDAVASLELRAVDGEVGLVDELVRVLAVLREAGDADRDGRADRLARRLDLEELARRRRGGCARRSRSPAPAASPGRRIENSSPPKRAGTS